MTTPMSTSQPWPPALPPTGRHCWAWQPTGLADLSRIRAEFRQHLAAGTTVLDEDEQAAAVLVLDELMSNAIRHGRAPFQVDVCATDTGLVLLVSDRAGDDPPRPTSTRDPAEGGMGLGIVASTALASGWCPVEDAKTVWALLPLPEQGTPGR